MALEDLMMNEQDFDDEQFERGFKSRYERVRDLTLNMVRRVLPSQQQYITFYVPYLNPLKYIDENGNLSYSQYAVDGHNMTIDHIDDLPLESLFVLYENLRKERSIRMKGW